MFAYFLRPGVFAFWLTVFCLAALAMALIAQYVYNMPPCILCLYQRIPFVLTALLALTACKLAARERMKGTGFLLILSGITLLANSILAFYHVGVEQHWWVSAFEACTFDPNNLREAVLNPPVPCDKIPWQDPILNLSMAAWNVVFCGAAGIFALIVGGNTLKKTKAA